jgi:hypothetical protein
MTSLSRLTPENELLSKLPAEERERLAPCSCECHGLIYELTNRILGDESSTRHHPSTSPSGSCSCYGLMGREMDRIYESPWRELAHREDQKNR